MREGNSRITLNLKSLSKIVEKGCRIKKLKQDEWTMLKDNPKFRKLKQDTWRTMLEVVILKKFKQHERMKLQDNFKLRKLK
jgi:hypothetical protein